MAPIFTGLKMGFGRIAQIILIPTYAVTPSTSSVNEGSSVSFNVLTTNVSDGTTLYWTLNTVSGTINSSDFVGGATSGSFTITSGTGSVTLNIANDVTTEGTESFQLQVRTDSTSGTVVVTSSTVTINDTSITFSATGGNLSAEAPPDGNTYHVFYDPGSLTVSSGSKTADLLLVGGGSCGWSGHGAGGAGGQVVFVPNISLTAGTYPITVGTGGSPPGPNGSGMPGTNTTGLSYTGYGGGADPGIIPVMTANPYGYPAPAYAFAWGPGPEYGNANSPSFSSSSNAGLGAGGQGANPNTTWRPGGNGRQVPAPFLPTNAPANLVTALGSTPTASPAWRYFGGGGGGGGGNGFENSKGGNGGLGGGGGGGTGPGGAGGDPGYGYPFPPGGPLGDAGQDRRGGGGGGGGIGACGTTYCPAKPGGKGVLIVRYSS
jgi:hypothetical protein